MTQTSTSQHAEPGRRRNHEQAYLERVRAVHARTEALHMKKTWIARKIRRSRPHVSSEPSHNNNTERPTMRGDVVVDDSCEERWVQMLVTRGVHDPVAVRLVERFGDEVVRDQVAHYDQLCSRGEAPRGVGWLVKAIEEGYPLPVREDAASKRYTYQEMLA